MLTEKNMYKKTASSVKKAPGSDNMFVAANTKAWAKLPKDFSPSTLGGMSVNPAPPDFKNMATADFNQLFHEAADSATKEFDRPYDILIKENEERKKRYDEKHDGEADVDLPEMKDVLVQTKSDI